MSEGVALAGSLQYGGSELQRLFECHGVVLAYLHGSQARGDAGPLSDVDVAVLFEPRLTPKERWDRRLALTASLTSAFHRSDVFVVDLAEATLVYDHLQDDLDDFGLFARYKPNTCTAAGHRRADT
jgi:predicted nucleotidyltransferase